MRNAKPQPIIVRFAFYKKRNKILLAEAKLKDSTFFQSAFFTEDITLLRAKLLRYIIRKNVKEYLHFATPTRVTYERSLPRKLDKEIKRENDEGIGSWITTSTPDDLFRHSIDVDFNSLG